MALRSRCSTALSASLLLLLPACASAAQRVPRGQRTRVLLVDTQHNHTLTLQNASSGSKEQIYRDTAGDSTLKIVSDEQLDALLTALDSEGMAEKATAAPLPGAKALIVLEQGDRKKVWSRPVPTADSAGTNSFDKGLRYVVALYNGTPAYHARDINDPEMAGIRKAIEEEKAKQQGHKQ
jgi:hypothetical protein